MSDNVNQNPEQAQAQQDAAKQPVFEVARIYSKDCSLETPNTPMIFNEEWKPEIKVDFDVKPQPVAQDLAEVDLRVTVTCKVGEKVAFICEVHQAGLFVIRNMDDATVAYLLGGVAPNMLFPYAREHISSLVGRGSFPPFYLRPMNFEAMFRARQAEALAKQQAEAQKAQENQPAQ